MTSAQSVGGLSEMLKRQQIIIISRLCEHWGTLPQATHTHTHTGCHITHTHTHWEKEAARLLDRVWAQTKVLIKL